MPPFPQVLPPSAELTPEGHLAVGGCDLVELARAHGTPLVVYDEGHLRANARAFRSELNDLAPGAEVVYASKAYWGLAMLRLIEEEGLSVDVASGGELFSALSAGIPSERIYMHGNNKDDREVAELLDARVGTVILDNLAEIDRIEAAASARGVVQRALVRVTPGVDPDTHSFIKTGHDDSKFGFPLLGGRAAAAVERVRRSPHLELIGIHAHIGSQLLQLSDYPEAARLLAAFALEQGGEDLGVVNMGGGLGIAYTREQQPPSVAEYCRAVVGAVHTAWEQVGLPRPRILIEPGRSMVGRAGLTLYSVGGTKDQAGWVDAAVDGGMSDLIRPMLYGATYEALLANRVADPEEVTVRIVGKHCESGDVQVQAARLAHPRTGDLIAIPATGAYGVSMASNYNGVTRPAVVFVDGGRARLVTRRETYADLVAREEPAPA
jgi:diaminopimelate decarboxylase